MWQPYVSTCTAKAQTPAGTPSRWRMGGCTARGCTAAHTVGNTLASVVATGLHISLTWCTLNGPGERSEKGGSQPPGRWRRAAPSCSNCQQLPATASNCQRLPAAASGCQQATAGYSNWQLATGSDWQLPATGGSQQTRTSLGDADAIRSELFEAGLVVLLRPDREGRASLMDKPEQVG